MQTKKNGLALRVLSTATFLAMVASCTAPAFAGTHYLENGDITVDAKTDGNYISQGELYQDHLDDGDTIITDHKDETDTSAVNNTVTINVDDNATGDVTIKDANINNNNTTEKAGISVDTKGENATANITLSNVTVDPGKDNRGYNNAGGAGLEVKGNGTANIELNGDNTLTGGTSHAGVEKSNSETDSKGVGEGKLVINDDYNDDGTEKTIDDRAAEVANGKYSGSLTANGSGSAGIGGSEWNSATSNITITGGNIIANGGRNSAGIGGAMGGTLVPGSGDAENIEITGGNIIANGSICSAGIGSGETGSTSIKISGGTIHASSKDGDQMGSGAGIGSGENGTGADITISGGTIYAEGSSGIGTGYNDWGGAKIDISDETDDTFIIASGEYNGRGIGSGYASSSNSLYDITINGGEIHANGGIGISPNGEGAPVGKITINGGKISAIATAGSAGIGNGWDTCGDVDNDGNGGTMDITITGGDITAVGGKGAAGIGDGKSNHYNTVNVTITGGTIKAVGGEGAAAIGGGAYQDDDEENLTKTTVKIDSSNRALKITAIVQGDSKGAIGNGTMEYDDPFSGVDFDDITAASLGEEHGALVQFMNNYDATTGTGTLYKAIHNKKYIEETYNNPNDDHEWGNPEIIKEAAPGVQGIIRYTCVVDGCGATHDVPYDYKAPDDTPTVTPTTPDAKPDTPATPDTPANPPVQDATADTTPADSAVLPGNAQNPGVLDAKPDAAVTPESAKNPAVQDAKALPQTGSNWLAVLGTALSGAFLMAVGFVLNRKRGENR